MENVNVEVCCQEAVFAVSVYASYSNHLRMLNCDRAVLEQLCHGEFKTRVPSLKSQDLGVLRVSPFSTSWQTDK